MQTSWAIGGLRMQNLADCCLNKLGLSQNRNQTLINWFHCPGDVGFDRTRRGGRSWVGPVREEPDGEPQLLRPQGATSARSFGVLRLEKLGAFWGKGEGNRGILGNSPKKNKPSWEILGLRFSVLFSAWRRKGVAMRVPCFRN